jgi:transglutaminase-like putative cysteine protease
MMMRKFFSRSLILPKAISLPVLAVFAAGATLCWFLPRVEANSVPEWLRAVAQEKLPDYSKDAVAVVLLDDAQTIVMDNGEMEVRTRRAYKLLRPEAREGYFGHVVLYFDNETKITFLRAWTITPDGHEIEVKDKDAVETSLSTFEVFSDQRAKLLKFPEANPGSIVGYEAVQKQRPFLFESVWGFQETVPVRKSRFSLQLPTGWEVSTLWANHAELKPQSPGPNEYVWEVDDSPAIEIEPDMPPWTTLIVHMHIKYYPRDPAMRSKTSGSWKDIGLWDYGLIAPMRVATPSINAKVAELTGRMENPLDKIKALAAFVQRQIRYAAIEIGIGGFQPHAAGDVFAHRYGDCKDKATLLNTMLREIGIESFNVIINTTRGQVAPEFPSNEFNHAILAIRLPENVSDTSLYAVVADAKLGRLLLFDPTNEYVPLGYLPSYLQDSYALVSTPDGGELIRTPLLPPPTNRLLRTAKLSLGPTGSLSGEIQELRWGGPAAHSREEFLETPPAKRAKLLEDFLADSLTNFTLTGATIQNLEKYDENLTVDYKFSAEGYAKTVGNLLVVRPRIVGAKGSYFLDILAGKPGKPRQYPIQFGEATRQDDMFDITLPSGYVVDELPNPVKVESPYGLYQSETQVTGDTLHYKRTYEIKDILIPKSELSEAQSFFLKIATDERSSVVLRRAN